MKGTQIRCVVTRQNSETMVLEMDSKCKGQLLLDQVCQRLGIIETDYFGLQYMGRKGERLWLNLRNQITRQLQPHYRAPYNFHLMVKFYVQPHFVLQEESRHEFYLQILENFHHGDINAISKEQLVKMVALTTKAHLLSNNLNNNTPENFTTYLPVPMQNDNSFSAFDTDIDALNVAINEEYKLLDGALLSHIEYQVLQEASEMRDWGVEYHHVFDDNGNDACIGVGPKGIIFLNRRRRGKSECLEFPAIQMATYAGKEFYLCVLTDRGHKRNLGFRLISDKASIGLYRCVTEKHSFYKCDTVRKEINAQYSRDIRGLFVSLFDENTSLGKCYIFDIRRTCREVYDQTRRCLYSNGVKDNAAYRTTNTEKRSTICDDILCRICMDAEITTQFEPCRHCVCCTPCAAMLEQCPLCRSTITNIMTPNNANRTCDEATQSWDGDAMSEETVSELPILTSNLSHSFSGETESSEMEERLECSRTRGPLSPEIPGVSSQSHDDMEVG